MFPYKYSGFVWYILAFSSLICLSSINNILILVETLRNILFTEKKSCVQGYRNVPAPPVYPTTRPYTLTGVENAV